MTRPTIASAPIVLLAALLVAPVAPLSTARAEPASQTPKSGSTTTDSKTESTKTGTTTTTTKTGTTSTTTDSKTGTTSTTKIGTTSTTDSTKTGTTTTTTKTGTTTDQQKTTTTPTQTKTDLLSQQNASTSTGPAVAGFPIVEPPGFSGQQLHGPVTLRWPNTTTTFPATAEKVKLTDGRVVAGTIEAGGGFSVTLAGHRFDVTSFRIDTRGPLAQLAYLPPPSATPRAIPLGTVSVAPDGLFSARASVPPGSADAAVAPPRGVAAALEGSRLVVTRNAKTATLDVRFEGALVRVPVTPPPVREARDLFFTEAPDRAYLFGRAARLSFDAARAIDASGVTVLAPGSVDAAFRGDAVSVLPLFVPKGFALEITSGTFTLRSSRVADVSLGGRIHLPPEYDARPIPFERLVRTSSGDGFQTEELSRGLFPLYLGEYSYRPNRAQLFVPGPVGGTGAPRGADAPGQQLPTDADAIDAWAAGVRTKLAKRGLHVWGGVLVAPWAVTNPPPPAAPAPPAPRMMQAIVAPRRGSPTKAASTVTDPRREMMDDATESPFVPVTSGMPSRNQTTPEDTKSLFESVASGATTSDAPSKTDGTAKTEDPFAPKTSEPPSRTQTTADDTSKLLESAAAGTTTTDTTTKTGTTTDATKSTTTTTKTTSPTTTTTTTKTTSTTSTPTESTPTKTTSTTTTKTGGTTSLLGSTTTSKSTSIFGSTSDSTQIGTRGAASAPAFIVDTSHRRRLRPTRGPASGVTTRALNPSLLGEQPGAGIAVPAFRELIDSASTRLRLPSLHPPQGGAFRLSSAGVEGHWVLMTDPEVRMIGRFKASVDRTYVRFEQNAVTDSSVRGKLLIPYPTNLEIGFNGTLSAAGEVMIPEDGLVAPGIDDGWYLDYWKMSVFPLGPRAQVSSRAAPKTGSASLLTDSGQIRDDQLKANLQPPADAPTRETDSASSGGAQQPGQVVIGVVNVSILEPPPPLVFAEDRILISRAEMRLDVEPELGGIEFRTDSGANPFEISVALMPNGNLEDADVRPTDAGATTFLGTPFYPYRSTIEVRRYVGDHRPPEPGEEPYVGWLVRMSGQLSFNLFGTRRAEILHTAKGARVPFIEPTATDEDGRPAPVLADSGGALYVDARLTFVNTFGMSDRALRHRFPPKNVDPARPYDLDNGDNLAIEPYKAFIGQGTISLIGALSVNGMAEAGQWLREDGELNGYEKVGVGGGIDIVKGVLAVVRGIETVAEIGGGVVEIVTGAEGLGQEVIHVSTDAVVFGGSVVSTVAVIAAAVTTGATATQIADEVRHLIGNGLDLSASTVRLLKKIYEQEPWYEPPGPDPKNDPPYIAMEVTEVLLDAAALGVNFEDLSPEEVASVLIRALDTGIEIMQRMDTGDLDVDSQAQFGLAVSHVIVGAAKMLIVEQRLTEEDAWELAQRMVFAAELFSELPQVRDEEIFEMLPLAVAVAQATVDIGSSVRFGDELDIGAIVDVTDQILTLTCRDPSLVAPLFDLTGVRNRDAMNVMATSQTVFGALNVPALYEGNLTPQQSIAQVLLPMIDDFVEGTAEGECAGLLRYDPYDAEVRALLRVARQVMRLSTLDVPTTAEEIDHQAMLAWSIGTVSETMNAVEVLQPGSVDDRVIAGLATFQQAVEEIDPDQPAASQVLQFSATMMPTVRDAVTAIPDIDPVAPKIVDVVAASLDAAVPLSRGEIEDVAQWLDGSLGVVNAVKELPLNADARAGLGIAARALELGRDGARGTLTPVEMVRGAQEIVDLLEIRVSEGGLRPAALLASNDPMLVMPVLDMSEAELASALGVASAVLDAVATSLETGTLSIVSVQSLVEKIVQALAPAAGLSARGTGTGVHLAADLSTRGPGPGVHLVPDFSTRGPAPGVHLASNNESGFAALGAMLTGIGILDPFTDAETAATRVMLTLLADAENGETDPVVIEAIHRARGALTEPDNRVANIDYRWDGGTYDETRSFRAVDAEGGLRAVHVKHHDGIFEAIYEFHYPAGHSEHPHGLHESHRHLPGRFTIELGESIIDRAEALLREQEFFPRLREYGLADGSKVRFEARFLGDTQTGPELPGNQQVAGTVTVSRPTEHPLYPHERVLEVSTPPSRGASFDEIQGTLLRVNWYEANAAYSYDFDSGRLFVAHVAGERKGDREVREVPTGPQYTNESQIPRDGKLLAYIGTHPSQGERRIEYRHGAPDIVVWEGESYDRLVIDGTLSLNDPALIPIGTDLIERRRHVEETDSDWFYRPGFHAIELQKCGSWRMHALGPLTELLTVPQPAGEIPVGDLLVVGDGFGGVTLPDGGTPGQLALDTMRITLDTDSAWVATPEGRSELFVTAGYAILSQGTRRELQVGGCDDEDTADRLLRHPLGDVARRGDGSELRASADSVREITVPMASQVMGIREQGSARRVTLLSCDRAALIDGILNPPAGTGSTAPNAPDGNDGFPVEAACAAADPAAQPTSSRCTPAATPAAYFFEYDESDPLLSASLRNDALHPPAVGEADRARKILFLNRFEEKRQLLLVSPTIERAHALLTMLQTELVGGRALRGIGARAHHAVAKAMDAVIRDELARLGSLSSSKRQQLRLWLEGLDPGSPWDRLVQALGVAEMANVPFSDRIPAEVLGLFPARTDKDPLVQAVAQFAALSYEGDCESEASERRTHGALRLARLLYRGNRCEATAPSLGAALAVGLDAIEAAQDRCIDLLTARQACDTGTSAPSGTRVPTRRLMRARLALEEVRQATGVQESLVVVPTTLFDGELSCARDRLDPEVLRDLPDDEVRKRVRDLIDIEGEAAMAGGANVSAMAEAGGAVNLLVDRKEKRFDDAFAKCDFKAVLGDACDAETLAGCTLLHDELAECPADDVIAEFRDYAQRVVDSMSVGGETSIDLARSKTLMEIGLVRSFDRAARARETRDVEKMRAALDDAQQLVSSSLSLGIDLESTRAQLVVRLGELSTAIVEHLEETNPAAIGGDDFEPYDRSIHLGIDTAARYRLNGATGPATPLESLIFEQVPAVQTRDLGRIQARLDRFPHVTADIDRLIRRTLDMESSLVSSAGDQATDRAGEIREKFATWLEEHPEITPRAPRRRPGRQPDAPSPYVTFMIEAWLDLDASGTTGSRGRAAAFLGRVSATYSADSDADREHLHRLMQAVEAIIERDRARRAAGSLSPVVPETDDLLAMNAAIAARIGDVAAAKRHGLFEEERAQRFAEAMNDRVTAQQAAIDVLRAEGIPEEDLQDSLAELQRLTDLAAIAEDSALRFEAYRGREEFLEDDLVDQLEEFARNDPLTVEAGAISGRLVDPKLISTGSPNRFKNAAARVETVLDRGGAHLRLVHRLGNALPRPQHGEGGSLRLKAIPALAGFMVAELGFTDSSAGIAGRGGVQPASLSNLPFDPEQLLVGVLQLTQLRPGQSPGPHVARLAQDVLEQLGQDAGDPVVKVGLTVTAASVDGLVVAISSGVESGEVDWLETIEAAANQLAAVYEPGAPPEDFWIGFGGSVASIGLRVVRSDGDPNVAAGEALRLGYEFLDYPDVAALVGQIPDPGGQLVVTVKDLMGETLGNIEGGDAFDIALARVMSDAAFSQIPAPYGPFGQDLSGWALDFAGAHRAEILAALTNTDDPVAWSGVTAELLKADGIPALTCIVNEHVDGLDVPPGVVLLPFVGSHELLASRELFEGDASQKPMVMLDVSAGLMNLWLSGAAQATCDNPVGIDEDTAFAMQIRGLKSFDLTEPGAAFQLLGAFGLGAVDTLAPGSTVARAMNTLWWGQDEPITNGMPPKGIGALATIDPSRTDEVLEFALGTPEIAGRIVAILAEDPALEKTMDVLAGNCRNEYLLPPDTCRAPDADNHHTLPNLMLTLLADMRRGAKPGLTRSQHGNDPQWGFLKTLPALSLGAGGIVNPLDVSDAQWQGSVDIASDIEESQVALQRSTLAVIDIARSTVGVLDALPSQTITGPTAASIQNASVFVDQVGGPMFSGVAGGLMREWELGTDPALADNYFELIGKLTIPALFNAATQFTYQNQGDDWMMMLRSGSNFPDATAMAEAMGLALPMDEIVGGAIGRSQSNFVGWMGVADDEPYMQVFAKQKYTLGSIEITEATVSGYVDDLGASDIGEKFANMDFGLCAEVEQAAWPPGNPYVSLFTMGMTPVATFGGYIQKRDGLISSGYKSGFAIDMSVPVVPIAGVRYGLDLGGFGEVEFEPDSLFPAIQFGTCARPYVSGNVFGIELGEVEASIEFAFFGDLDDPDAEAGLKLRYEIAPEQYDLLRENLSCDVPPGPIEWVLCPIIDLAGEDLGIWLTLTNEAIYFGLGRFPNNGEEVIAAEFLPGGGIGLPGFKTVEGWGGFTKGDFSACADDLCGTIDAPPPGARYYDEPSLEGEDL